jgi:hypothetical protein
LEKILAELRELDQEEAVGRRRGFRKEEPRYREGRAWGDRDEDGYDNRRRSAWGRLMELFD